MRQEVLDRYDRDSAGTLVIDVSAARIEELYNDFDKSAPYIRRDLDENLAEYLSDSARELCPAPFIIRFTFDYPPNEAGVRRIESSLNTYFLYLADIELHNILQLFRRSFILFSIGLCILVTSVWLNLHLENERSIIADVFAEGLTIAAWVSIWEALAIVMIEWFPHRRNRQLYRRLAQASLAFRSAADRPSDTEMFQPHP
ncbi:hypothetical protein [Marinobacterium sediminicola]|uniref:CHASE2 domain-containing protein n=1 Tax=Marinobacterium sediminicola TaxID=518898 RepID=A0ABY1RW26_9GAMM|nr:hypothetical protein [Marinobacterium sediminicola]ULG70474.1 hypothetical protein LN244_06560 [Marinobacterium sediminicola]SMR69241.1 hypothetical protein SAMN04487964_101188 [Marinobacterium sediminicola]